jgi:hypothetical protein
MTSILKVDTIQDTAGNNIINESSDTITIGASGDTITIPAGATISNLGTASGFGGANTPAFEAYTTALQSITDDTYTKMTMATEVFDTDGDYDNVTNYRFTPQTAGKYFVYGKGFADPSSYGNLKNTQMRIYKNGAAIGYTTFDIMPGANLSADGGTGATPSVRAVIEMNGTTDYVEIFFKLTTWSGSGAQVGSKQFGAYRIIE